MTDFRVKLILKLLQMIYYQFWNRQHLAAIIILACCLYALGVAPSQPICITLVDNSQEDWIKCWPKFGIKYKLHIFCFEFLIREAAVAPAASATMTFYQCFIAGTIWTRLRNNYDASNEDSDRYTVEEITIDRMNRHRLISAAAWHAQRGSQQPQIKTAPAPDQFYRI